MGLIIGDVHGCYYSLMDLLHKAKITDSTHLYFVGDLVNRGKHNEKVLQFIYSLHAKGCATTVLGNHDLYLIAVYLGHKRYPQSDNFDTILKHKNGGEWIEWLSSQPFVHLSKTKKILLTHASVPNWHLTTILERHNWLTNHLQDATWKKQLFQNYLMGNHPKQWQHAITDFDKARLLINYFTRVRYYNAQAGTPSFTYKDAPSKAPPNLIPWYNRIDPSVTSNQTLFFGHWSALPSQETLFPKSVRHLDTGCAWQGKLSALRLSDNQIIRVPQNPLDRP